MLPQSSTGREPLEPLDEPLIKSLVYERDAFIKREGLIRLGKKYKYPFKENTAINELELWLTSVIFPPALHGKNYETH